MKDVRVRKKAVKDSIWKDENLVEVFLDGVRGGLPCACEQVDCMLRVLAAGFKGVEGIHFLDLGCGDGILSATIFAHFPTSRGVLLDFSEPMLEQARVRLAPFRDRLKFVEVDFGKPRWHAAVSKEAPFDAVVTGYAIHHQPDARKRALYQEIFDILKPGGVFLNVEHVASADPWVEGISDELLVDSLFSFHQSRGGRKTRVQVAREFVHRPDKAANILAPVDEQCAWLRSIGFRDVDCFFKVFELAVFGGRKPGTFQAGHK